jgi:Rieske Fe-S protein
MPDAIEKEEPERGSFPGTGRRKFLLLLPYAVLAGMTATLAGAAFRFLRPQGAQAAAGDWTDVAPLKELTGDGPIMRSIMVEQRAGWSSKLEEQIIYVLPQQNRQVLTAACPHEGCNVSWQAEQNRFACPCHDSYFAADGSRISGPARRGLDPLPSREENERLQVQFRSFENNTGERVVRE